MKSQAYSERRLARFAVDPSLLANMAGGTFRVAEGGAPPDAELVALEYEADSGPWGRFWLALAHPSFSPVPEGDISPELKPPMIERVPGASLLTPPRVNFREFL